MKVLSCLLIFLLSFITTWAQLVEIPLGHYPTFTPKASKSGRTQSSPLNLPFWDDFSYSDTLNYPQENLWLYGKSVYLNNGIGLNAPSKNVVTFDGVDSLGRPYNVNDRVAKGFADNLISQPIRMDLVDPALRSTVYFSFYFQVMGNGEAPDDGDNLTLAFLNNTGAWETVYSQATNDSLTSDTFYQVTLPIIDNKFYHDQFQFRFRNTARLSGPYDTWNLDYVYLNSGRSANDTSFPDRTVSSSLNSLFQIYYSMPYKHFLEKGAANLKHPTIKLYNLRAGNQQPFDYNTNAIFSTWHKGVKTMTNVPLDQAQDPGFVLTGLQFANLTLNKIPGAGAFDPTADSIDVQLKYKMATKDNVLPANNGDYDPAKYSPIDFRTNDLTSTHYNLSNYYSYDDGKAEYAAGFNKAGSYLAFKFPIRYSKTDTLVAVDIYFPDFGDNSSASLFLQVRTNLTDAVETVLYQQTIQVTRTSQNLFTRYRLADYVLVKDTLIIGWKQLTNVSIPVGLDKNNDNGDKIFYNTNGEWIQNTSVLGSIMVRPIFGKGVGDGIITGLEPEPLKQIYPNPTSRICYLPIDATDISAFDITGRRLETEQQSLTDRQSLTFVSPVSGLVVIHYFINGKSHAEKIMVRRE